MRLDKRRLFNLYQPSQMVVTALFVLLLLAPNVAVYSQASASTPDQAQSQSPQPPPSINIETSPSLAEKTGSGLKWFFTVLVYPAIVVGVFILLVLSIFYVTSNGSGFGYIRRFTGALLPVLLLTFILLQGDKGEDPIKSFLLNRNPFIYVFSGILIGILLVEFGKRLIRTDDDRWGAIYNLFLSLMVVFLLYSYMKGFLDSLIYFLFSMIMAGGLDIIFGQPMEFANATSTTKRIFGDDAKPSRRDEQAREPVSSKVPISSPRFEPLEPPRREG